MRKPPPLILGAGPAGCAAAITLARAGSPPLLIDRDTEPRDPLCGGFLSWRTAAQLADLGVDCAKLGAHKVETLRLFRGDTVRSIRLPQAAYGLSRHALDTELRHRALAAGARFAVDTLSELLPGRAIGKAAEWPATCIFLATGKHDLRGANRPRSANDPALGLRLVLPPSPERQEMLAGAIELHLFRGGYAGLVLQDGGRANLCMALRKSTLARVGNSRKALLSWIAADNPALAARLGNDWRERTIDTVGAVPYGWVATGTQPGLFRLGDQAAVIPSLAGEGIGIALASGCMAARHWLAGGEDEAPEFQRTFARSAAGPMRLAGMARSLAESPAGASVVLAAAALAPSLLTALADRTRITG